MSICGRKKQSEFLRVHDVLAKGENPLSEEEIHSILTCHHILKVIVGDKVNYIATVTISEGEGDPGSPLLQFGSCLRLWEVRPRPAREKPQLSFRPLNIQTT